mmetsp:Transcript_38589/g.56818  ORF Transcript_38589/g.56818 Transcript_38589/m.56818 type:complete len:114 (+) Transcript_38589:1311-1652(+)
MPWYSSRLHMIQHYGYTTTVVIAQALLYSNFLLTIFEIGIGLQVMLVFSLSSRFHATHMGILRTLGLGGFCINFSIFMLASSTNEKDKYMHHTTLQLGGTHYSSIFPASPEEF